MLWHGFQFRFMWTCMETTFCAELERASVDDVYIARIGRNILYARGMNNNIIVGRMMLHVYNHILVRGTGIFFRLRWGRNK